MEEKFNLKISDVLSLKFTGKRIARSKNSNNISAGYMYSGSPHRWTEFYLYKTVEGQFVCYQIEHVQEHETLNKLFSYKFCQTEKEVMEFFGNEWLAKEIYCEAEFKQSN